MVHINHKRHANHTRLILAVALLIFFTSVLASSPSAPNATMSISAHEPLLVAANVSSAIAADVSKAMNWGVFDAMSKLYAAYLFVLRSSLIFSAVILLYPEVLGLGPPDESDL
ncbi:UNVERIFIED_CONTAM: hypothetical protein HDU68_011566 [Siphonaria sp. JEL0065]|nr:hypothetical protein HDU68_011566 [Siphonaria sp. JEL0065]